MDSDAYVWDVITGTQIGRPLKVRTLTLLIFMCTLTLMDLNNHTTSLGFE
jgi:hypothetical protein